MPQQLQGTKTPWSYFFVRLLFKFVLKIFYGTIVVENVHLVPKYGPCIVCSNHSNSLTDALLLVCSIPSKIRGMLRLTAKSTQFGHPTFTSWLIESAGTIPIKRKKDFASEETVDNSGSMEKLVEGLEIGDAVCLFPEGASRYHPTIQPLKTGVARIISDILTRNRNNPDFQISLQTCSVTYMHAHHFRSDVLVVFHPPIVFTPKTHPELLAPVDFNSLRALTSRMQEAISSGTTDAPSWRLVRLAKLAASIYAPLGTSMSLGDHVRVVRTFLNAFKVTAIRDTSGSGTSEDESPDITSATKQRRIKLCEDLNSYQDQLVQLGIKDDRLRKPIPRYSVILPRLFVRIVWCATLLTLSLPGLLLWLPILLTTFYAVHNFKKTGPIWDTFDEIAQYKLVYGLFSGLAVWCGCVVVAFLKKGLLQSCLLFWLVPALMWLTLRWMEDAIASFRAAVALWRLSKAGRTNLEPIREQRSDLYTRTMELAVKELGLPENPEEYFMESHPSEPRGEKGRVVGKWQSGAKYFSVKRRRKRDWNETLRWYDKVDYPED